MLGQQTVSCDRVLAQLIDNEVARRGDSNSRPSGQKAPSLAGAKL
jgi:hypothetical protein